MGEGDIVIVDGGSQNGAFVWDGSIDGWSVDAGVRVVTVCADQNCPDAGAWPPNSDQAFSYPSPPVLGPGRARFFDSPLADRAIGRLGEFPVVIDQDRAFVRSVSPTTVSINVGNDGSLQVSDPFTEYTASVRRGEVAISELGRIFSLSPEEIARMKPEDFRAIQQKAEGLLAEYRGAAEKVRDVFTKNGMNEYEAKDQLLNRVFNGHSGEEQSVSMIGFNMAGINKIDPTYVSGNAVYVLFAKYARIVAAERGGEFLGTWRTNMVVAGIDDGQLPSILEEVQARVMKHIADGAPFEPKEAAMIGARDASVLSMRGKISSDGRGLNLGITVGFGKIQIPTEGLTTAGVAEAEAKIVGFLQDINEREMEAKRTSGGKAMAIFAQEVPQGSPIKGAGAIPLLRNNSKSTDRASLRHGGPQDRLPTAEDIRSGMPRPGHEGGHALGQANALDAVMGKMKGPTGGWEKARWRAVAPEAAHLLKHPEGGRNGSALVFFREAYQGSLRHMRFNDVYRIESFPYVAEEFFGGKKGYLLMLEGKNMYGIFAENPPDKLDSLLRVALNVPDEVGREAKLEAIFAMRGDEVYMAIRGTKKVTMADGSVREVAVTQEDIGNFAELVRAKYEEVFGEVWAQQRVKLPGPGGLFRESPYVVKDGKVYIAGELKGKGEFLETVNRSFGTSLAEGDVVVLDDLSQLKKLGETSRLNIFVSNAIDPATGKPLSYIFLPADTPSEAVPRGYAKFEIPFQMTISPGVEIPRGSLSHVRMGLDLVNGRVDAQKSLVGPDLMPESPVERLPWAERMESTWGGRVAMGGGYYAAGHLVGGVMMQGEWGRLIDPSEYLHMGLSYGAVAVGDFGGQVAARYTVSPALSLLGASGGMRMFAVRGGGLLGVILLPQLLATGRIDGNEAMKGMASIGIARMGSRGSLAGLRWGTMLAARRFKSLATVAKFFERGSLPTKIIGIVLEFAIIGWLTGRSEKKAIRNEGGRLRKEYLGAFRDFDQSVAAASAATSQGDFNAKMAVLGERAERLNETFISYLGFEMMTKTAAGQRYLSARRRLTELNQEAGELAMGCHLGPGDGSACHEKEEVNAKIPDAESAVETAQEEMQTEFPRLVEYETDDLFQVRNQMFLPDGRTVFVPMSSEGEIDRYGAAISDSPVDLYIQHVYSVNRRLEGIDPWGEFSPGGVEVPVEVGHESQG